MTTLGNAAGAQVHACNCMYGTQDPRCCIARARRRELEEAWRLGREGKPLPPEKEPVTLPNWGTIGAIQPATQDPDQKDSHA